MHVPCCTLFISNTPPLSHAPNTHLLPMPFTHPSSPDAFRTVRGVMVWSEYPQSSTLLGNTTTATISFPTNLERRGTSRQCATACTTGVVPGNLNATLVVYVKFQCVYIARHLDLRSLLVRSNTRKTRHTAKPKTFLLCDSRGIVLSFT